MWAAKPGIILFYALRVLPLFPQRLIYPVAAIGKKTLCLQISVKIVKIVLKSENARTAILVELVHLQLFKVYHASMKILQLLNTYNNFTQY